MSGGLAIPIRIAMPDRLRAALRWLQSHALSIQSWASVLLTAASTLVAYGVVLPGHASYRVLGAVVAVLTVLAARSSAPPSTLDRP